MPSLLMLDIVRQWLTTSVTPCLFLDIDGTLAPFTANPRDSRILTANALLIQHLFTLGMPIAIVTGRSLVEARHMLPPVDLPIGATHGLEIALTKDSLPLLARVIQNQLAMIIEQIEAQCQAHKITNLLIEKKPYSVALHYRQQPNLADIAEAIMQQVAKNFASWQIKSGKFVWEILPKGADKGQAVTVILQHFNQISQSRKKTLLPIFIGDDVSDEAGFLAVQQHNGIAIKVGQPMQPTHANYYVSDINEVTQILQLLYQHYQVHAFSADEPMR